MRPATREEERLTEDEIARKKLGPRGVPGGQDTAKMTPQAEHNIPKTGYFEGHTARSNLAPTGRAECSNFEPIRRCCRGREVVSNLTARAQNG